MINPEMDKSEDAKRRQLGRGIAALMEEDETVSGEHGNYSMVSTDHISPSRIQVRRNFAPSEIEELANSIRLQGILQPVLLRHHPDIVGQFELLAGERRWRAAKLVGLHEIPAMIRQFSDRDAMEASLVENLQRSDLTSIEEAEGYRRLIDQHGLTQENVANSVGKSRSHVANILRLLNLPDEVKERIGSGELSAGQARALLAVDDPAEMARTAVENGMTVRELEAAGTDARTNRRSGGKKVKDRDLDILEKKLIDALGLHVVIQGQKKGVVKIHYQDLQQLDHLVQKLIAQN